MAQPTQLTPTEQDALVKQIGLAMLRVAPDDWEQLTVDYRAVGRYSESTGQVVYADGGTEPWTMPADLQSLFARLRAGMYRESRGTWFNARYRLDHPSSYNLEYDREEPVWEMPPPPQAYPDDMRLFPRTDDNVPEWLRRRLAAAPPPGPPPGAPMPDRGPGPRFRVARIFDGPGEDGRPSVNRPPVDEMDIQDILKYLDNAPLVGPARGYDVDRLDPNGQQTVPVAFHTDGTWIWPAAVNYFLREHDIAPEPDLIEHIRRMRFTLPQVDDQTRNAAQAFLGPPPPGPGGPRPGPPAPAPTRAMPVPSPAPKMPPMAAPLSPPRAALPSQGPVGQELDQLRTRLDDLDVPETAYRIGPPTGRGWTMEQTEDGWRVGWHDQSWVAPAMFEDVADASAFLLGKLMLDTDRWAAGPKNPELPPMSPPLVEDHGFEPLSAPLEEFEPMSGPDFAPGTSIGPPPGTPGFSSPGFGGPPPGTPGFSPPPGTPPRSEPAHTMAMEPPSPPRGEPLHTMAMEPPNSHGLQMDPPSPPRGEALHSLGLDQQHGMGLGQPRGSGLDQSRGIGPDQSRGSGPDQQHGLGLDQSRGNGLDQSRGSGLDQSRGSGLDQSRGSVGMDHPRGSAGMDQHRGESHHAMDQSRGEATLLARPTNGAASAPAGADWPITPLPGEPPLTLFRGKRVVELEPGTEIDRFGGDEGNLVYAVGTPFAERSLVPDWIDRPYHVYRVRQSFQALTGAAIPWFDQPGGGTAYLLPDAIGDLVAHGHLVEVGERDRPR